MMKIVKPFGKFGKSESKLSLFELIKQDKNNVFKGNILIQRLTNKEPLYTSLTRKVEILNSQEIIDNIVDSRGKYSPYRASKFFKKNNRYIPVFQTDQGMLRLNDIYRTRTFGSSAGTSLGTVATRLNESIQALFLSLRQEKGESLTENDYDNIVQYTDDKTTVREDLLKNLRIPVLLNEYIMFDFSNWFHTHTQVANELFKNLDESKTYIIFQSFYGDGLSKALHTKFQELVKLEGINFKVTIARWNPSDLYLVDSNSEDKITNEILNCTSLDQLNILMDGYFDSKELVSICVKKVQQDDMVSLVVTKDESPKFIYTNSSMSEDPFESMTVYVNAVSDFNLNNSEKEKLEVRIFSGIRESNVYLEIKGKSGKYGKINIKYLNHILKNMDLEPLPQYTDLQGYDYEQLINLVDKMYIKLEGKVDYTKPTIRKKSGSITEHRSKLISKYQSLLLVMMLEENKDVEKVGGQSVSDYLLTKMFYYGYSLKNDFFETCKYYRVKTSKME